MGPHCDYVSNNSIQATGNYTVSIQYIDGVGDSYQLDFSGSTLEIESEIISNFPNYGGVVFDESLPVAIRLSEYQLVSGYSDDGSSITPLNFTQSNCVSLPIQSTLSQTTTSQSELMDYDLLRDSALVELWLSWFALLMYAIYVTYNTLKYAIK